jgi:hypothetical protein
VELGRREVTLAAEPLHRFGVHPEAAACFDDRQIVVPDGHRLSRSTFNNALSKHINIAWHYCQVFLEKIPRTDNILSQSAPARNDTV